MATYSIKPNAAVAVNTNGTGVVYTAPANGYAVLNIFIAAGASNVEIRIGGADLFNAVPTNQFVISGVMVGPSQTVLINNNPGGNLIGISGTQFVG